MFRPKTIFGAGTQSAAFHPLSSCSLSQQRMFFGSKNIFNLAICRALSVNCSDCPYQVLCSALRTILHRASPSYARVSSGIRSTTASPSRFSRRKSPSSLRRSDRLQRGCDTQKVNWVRERSSVMGMVQVTPGARRATSPPLRVPLSCFCFLFIRISGSKSLLNMLLSNLVAILGSPEWRRDDNRMSEHVTCLHNWEFKYPLRDLYHFHVAYSRVNLLCKSKRDRLKKASKNNTVTKRLEIVKPRGRAGLSFIFFKTA